MTAQIRETIVSMEITFELSDDDLNYFRKVMLSVRKNVSELDEEAIIENARTLFNEVCAVGSATDES